LTAITRTRIEGLRGWRLGVVLFAIVFLLHLAMFTTPVWDNDEAFIATVAQVMSDGGRLYVDVFDRKPPLVFLLYQGTFALTGTTALWGPRLLGVLALTANAGLLTVFARPRLGDRGAVIAGVLGALTTATLLPGDAQAANFEVFMLPGITAAMVLADRSRPGWAGIALGIAACAKQPALAAFLPIALLAWRSHRARGFALAAGGTLVPLAVAAAIFGPADFVFWVFSGNEGYLDVGGDWNRALSRMYRMTIWIAALNAAIIALLPAAWRDRRRDLDVWLWLATGLVAASVGFRFWGHYYWQVLPPLCFLAASALTRRLPRLSIPALGITTVIAVGAAGAALLKPDVPPAEPWKPIADYVAEHTGPDDRVFVWGHVPEIYWASGRLPATQVVTTGFLTGHTGGRPPDRVGMHLAVPGVWDDFMERIESDPPDMILVATDSGIRSAQHYPPSMFPRFGDYLEERFELVDRVNGMDVYEPQ
jgi:hypothetical protein